MDAGLIAAIVALLGAIGAYLKNKSECDKIIASRQSTKEVRDKDSQEIRDKVILLDQKTKTNEADIAKLWIDNSQTNKELSEIRQELVKIATILEERFSKS